MQMPWVKRKNQFVGASEMRASVREASHSFYGGDVQSQWETAGLFLRLSINLCSSQKLENIHLFGYVF